VSGARRWRLWIDTGGTFTDALGVDPEGRLHRTKVLSSSALRGRLREMPDPRTAVVETSWEAPAGFCVGAGFRWLGESSAAEGGGEVAAVGEPGVEVVASEPVRDRGGSGGPERTSAVRLDLALPLLPSPEPGRACELRFPEEAPVLAARLLTGAARCGDLPRVDLRLATTRGTNALLTHQGGSVALFVTRGFADLLAIGTQQRPDLFALEIRKPRPYYREVVEVPERLAADGSVLAPLSEEVLAGLRPRVEALLAGEGTRGGRVEGAAIALLHSYLEPEPERRLAAFLSEAGFPWVVTSSELAPLIQILPRAETAVVEAFLAPVIREYLAGVRDALPAASGLHVKTSAGGLVRAEEFRAKDSLLSGPAGGVVGAARAGRRSGFERVIPFDMGGTSTDVARFDGDYEYVFEHRVGDARLMAPALAIESVAAGGGSICRFDGDRLRVGPESAGAHPGPACYGAGGPLTLTDVNLLLGRLDAERFGIPVDTDAAERALAALGSEVAESGGERPERDALLSGLLRIADERMADAIREISVRRGYDPREYALVAFGGAGAQHACAVAELLGVTAVVVPRDAGLLSAHGLGAARLERFAHRQVLRPLTAMRTELSALLAEMAGDAREAVAREGVVEDDVEIRRRIVQLRFRGQDSTIPVEVEEVEVETVEGGELVARVEAGFDRAYRARYGYRPERREIEVESVRVVASSKGDERALAREPRTTQRTEPPEPFDAEPADRRPVVFGGRRGGRRGERPGGHRETPIFERSTLRSGARLAGPALVIERHSATVVAPGWRCRMDGAGALVLERDYSVSSSPAAGAKTESMSLARSASASGTNTT
jgi:5-oxoprolinase (ATP-hydrolysing)